MSDQRPSILLYSASAQISDDVRAQMIEAGYLPILVEDQNSVRILPALTTIDAFEMSVITQAALAALAKSGESTQNWTSAFGIQIARLLLAANAKKETP